MHITVTLSFDATDDFTLSYFYHSWCIAAILHLDRRKWTWTLVCTLKQHKLNLFAVLTYFYCICACEWCHQDGGVEATRLLDNSNFRAISHGIGTFAADGLSSTHTGHTLEPAMQLPIGSRCRFCQGFVSVSIETQQHLRSIGLPLSTPPFHHTAWGLLSWQLDHTTITATSGFTVLCGLPGLPWWPFLRPRYSAISSYSPRAI